MAYELLLLPHFFLFCSAQFLTAFPPLFLLFYTVLPVSFSFLPHRLSISFFTFYSLRYPARLYPYLPHAVTYLSTLFTFLKRATPNLYKQVGGDSLLHDFTIAGLQVN